MDDVMQKFALKLDVLVALTTALFRRVNDNSSGDKMNIYPIFVP